MVNDKYHKEDRGEVIKIWRKYAWLPGKNLKRLHGESVISALKEKQAFDIQPWRQRKIKLEKWHRGREKGDFTIDLGLDSRCVGYIQTSFYPCNSLMVSSRPLS